MRNLAGNRGMRRIAAGDTHAQHPFAVLDEVDDANVRKITHREMRDVGQRLFEIERSGELGTEFGKETLFVVETLASADIAYKRLPAAVGQDVRSDLRRNRCPALVSKRPFARLRTALDLTFSGGFQPLEIFAHDHVHDRRSDDLVT